MGYKFGTLKKIHEIGSLPPKSTRQACMQLCLLYLTASVVEKLTRRFSCLRLNKERIAAYNSALL